MKLLLLAIAVVGVMLSGCVYSLSPLYSPGPFAFREDMLGEWLNEADDLRLRIEPRDEDRRYLVTLFDAVDFDAEHAEHAEPPSAPQFIMTLVILGDHLFADVESLSESQSAGAAAFLSVPVHFFAKLNVGDDELAFAQMCDRWLRERLTEHPGELSCVRLSREGVIPLDSRALLPGSHLLITASTSDLQRFVTAHADDPEAWAAKATFKRRSQRRTPLPGH